MCSYARTMEGNDMEHRDHFDVYETETNSEVKDTLFG